MPQQYVDLHSHSTASDGTCSPQDVARLAKESGLSAFALTDHDTTAGVERASAAAREIGIDFIGGIEISATYPRPGTLHMLGYGVDAASPTLLNLSKQLIAGRDDRNPQIIARLNELNVAITMDELREQAKGGVMGRPHIAAILVRKGYVATTQAAFDKYLGEGGLAYFDKERLSPAKAIEMVRAAGGLAVLAHPVQLRTENDAQLDTVVKGLVDLGLAGIEVIHSDHDGAWVEKCDALAKKYSLLRTGGSDFHGANKTDIAMGLANGRKIPREWFDALVERCRAAA